MSEQPIHEPGDGSLSQYTKQGCRCQECRDLFAAYMRTRRAKETLGLEKIDDEDLTLALARIAVDEQERDPITVAALRSHVLAELNRRLSDKKTVAGLPGTALLQLAKELIKDKTEDTQELPRDPTITEIVQAVNLPPERKKELLEQEQTWLAGQVAACREALHELEEVA